MLTKKSNERPVMVDSATLALFAAQRRFGQVLAERLVVELSKRGHGSVSATHLAFLGALECGPNSVSAVARDMGISRQAVHRQSSELIAMGLLAQESDPERGNAKIITFTPTGEQVMADARQILLDFDQTIGGKIGADRFQETVSGFAAVLDALDADG